MTRMSASLITASCLSLSLSLSRRRTDSFQVVPSRQSAMDLLSSWSKGRRTHDKDDDVKNEITRELTRAVRVLHADHVTDTSSLVFSCSTTNELCYSLEAVFLHGLRAVSSDKPATWCFWDLLIACLHRSVIKHLSGLSQISPGIGTCRAWIRMALNGGELLCYLQIMLNDATSLGKFYEDWAYLRDIEHSTFLKTAIQGLERIHFSLSYNSSLLNTWTGRAPSLVRLESSVLETTYGIFSEKKTDISSSWSNVDEQTPSTTVDCVAADSRRDTSFDDFNLESSERVELAEMFHGCENITRPTLQSILSTSVGVAVTVPVTTVPVLVPAVASRLSVDDHDEGAWSAASDVELSSSTGQHHPGVVVAGGRWASTSTWTNKYNPSNVVGRLRSNKPDLATRKRCLERQRPHSVAEEVLRDWNDDEKDAEQRSVMATGISTTIARQECSSADFERWLGTEHQGVCPGGGGRGSSHRIPWSCSVDSGQSSVDSSCSCSSLDHLSLSAPASSGIVFDVGSSSRFADDVNGRSRRSLPVIVQGGEDEFLFETPYESESYLTILNNYSRQPFRIPSQMSLMSDEDLEISQQEVVCSPKQPAPVPMTSHSTDTTYGEWIVMDYDEHDYVVKPFHVENSTAHLHQFVTTENQESSLVKQEGRCVRCFRSIGTSAKHRAHVCHFTGHYYCSGCYGSNKAAIPAKIIHDWDFTKYKVSTESSQFLAKTNDWPMLDVSKLNNTLLDRIEHLATAHKLRLQITHIVRYMMACTADDCQKFWHWMNPRFHVFQHIHHYSVKELEGVKDGSHLKELRKIVKLGVSHIKNCERCSSCGFICEVCNSDDVIFPYDIELTSSCPECHAVYHKRCCSDEDSSSLPVSSCVRCYRISQRKRNSVTVDAEAVCSLVDQVVFCFPTDMS